MGRRTANHPFCSGGCADADAEELASLKQKNADLSAKACGFFVDLSNRLILTCTQNEDMQKSLDDRSHDYDKERSKVGSNLTPRPTTDDHRSVGAKAEGETGRTDP